MAKGNKVLNKAFLSTLNAKLKSQDARIVAASGCIGRYLVQRRITQEVKERQGYKSRSYYSIGICYGEALIALLTAGDLAVFKGENKWYNHGHYPDRNMAPIVIDKDTMMLLKLSAF